MVTTAGKLTLPKNNTLPVVIITYRIKLEIAGEVSTAAGGTHAIFMISLGDAGEGALVALKRGGSITTAADFATGVILRGDNVQFTMEDGTITTTRGNAYGVALGGKKLNFKMNGGISEFEISGMITASRNATTAIQ